ncbi:MAG TPA: hypothetical protein VM661_17340 [Candidatus Sulfotelmatobacter sp.]|jgi:hypothetical protein|nr:hypothetical protein [Candidatus Sulfotelmatobacter sp.]
MRLNAAVLTLAAGLILAGCTTSPLSPNAKSDGTASSPSFSQFSDLPVPAKATMNVDQSLLLGNGESWTGRLVYSSWTNASGLYDFYKGEMPGFGWQEITSIRASISVQTWIRDTRVCTIQIKDSTFGSDVIVTMAPAGPGGAVAAPGGAGGYGNGAAAPVQPVTKSNIR